MAAVIAAQQFYVGTFRVERLKGIIEHAGLVHHLSPKAMEVLVVLAQNAQNTVSRDTIEQEVWGTTEVSDAVVTKAISEIRHAFDDHREHPDFIQTIPKQGYRLIAEVHWTDNGSLAEEKRDSAYESQPLTLWEEMKRRKVIRVAVAYAGVAWLTIQFADTVFPFVGIPYGTTSLIVALIILGFPVAIVAAWMIEKNTSGLILDKVWLDDRKAAMLRRRNLNIIVIAMSIIAITIAANIVFRSQPAYTFEQRDWVVLADFENLTAQDMLDESLGRAFRIRMSQSPYVNLLPENVVRESLVRMAHEVNSRIDRNLASEIAIREEARAVVVAGIAQVGDQYSLTAEIINPADNAVVHSRSVTAEAPDKILTALESLADSVRTDLGESLPAESGSSDIPLQRVTTSDLEALNLYSIAVQRLHAGQYESAVDLLHRALEIDVGFASAYATLGTVLSQMGRPRLEYEPFLQQAIDNGERLPIREKLHIEATMSWLDTPDKMERAWTLVTNVYPDDAEAHHNLGRAYLQYLNDGEQALYSFERAAALPKAEKSVTLIYLGFSQLFNNRADDALESFQSALAIDNNPRNFALADGYIVLRQYDAAKQFLDEYTRVSTPVFDLFRQIRLHLYHLDRGELMLALSALDEADAVFSSLNDRHSPELELLALSILELLEDPDEFNPRLQSSLRNVSSILNSELSLSQQSQNVNLLLSVAAIAARNGWVGEARNIYEADAVSDAIQGFPVRISFHKLLGAELAAVDGDLQGATAILEESHNRVETFPVREALARLYRAAGNYEQAIVHYEWIRQNRGRAFAEWHEDNSDRGLNVLNWAMAALHLASIHEELGDREKAVEYYSQFVDHWELGDQNLALLVDARSRLVDMIGN